MATKKSNNIQSVPTKEKKLEGRMNVTTKQLDIIFAYNKAFRLTLRDNGNTWKDVQKYLEQNGLGKAQFTFHKVLIFELLHS